MDKEIELMKAKENQIFQVHYKLILDMLWFLSFDQNEVKLLLNNLNDKKIKSIFNIKIIFNNFKH